MGTQLPLKRGTALTCRPMFVAKRLGGSRCHLVRRWASAQATLCYTGTQIPQKGGTAPNFRPMSIVAKRSSISAIAEHLLFICLRLLLLFTIRPVRQSKHYICVTKSSEVYCYFVVTKSDLTPNPFVGSTCIFEQPQVHGPDGSTRRRAS